MTTDVDPAPGAALAADAAPTPPAARPAPGPGRPRIRQMRYEPLQGERFAEPARAAAAGRPVTVPTPRVPPMDRGARNPAAARDQPGRGQRGDDRLRADTEAVLRLVLEVLDGQRAPGQLAGHLTAPAVRCVRAAARGGGRSRLTSLRICRPLPGVAEVAAVYRIDGRARAIAARFEQSPAPPLRWRCVAVRLG